MPRRREDAKKKIARRTVKNFEIDLRFLFTDFIKYPGNKAAEKRSFST